MPPIPKLYQNSAFSMWMGLLKILTKGTIVHTMLFLRLLRVNVVHQHLLKRMMYSATVRARKVASGEPLDVIEEPGEVRDLRRQQEEVLDHSFQNKAKAFLDKWEEYVVKEANEKLAKARIAKDTEFIPRGLQENERTFETCVFTWDVLPLIGYALKKTPDGAQWHLNCDYVKLDLWVREHGRDLEGSAAGPEDFSPNTESNNYISAVMQDVWPELKKDIENNARHNQISKGISNEQRKSLILLWAHSWFHKGIEGGKFAFHTIAYG